MEFNNVLQVLLTKVKNAVGHALDCQYDNLSSKIPPIEFNTLVNEVIELMKSSKGVDDIADFKLDFKYDDKPIDVEKFISDLYTYFLNN